MPDGGRTRHRYRYLTCKVHWLTCQPVAANRLNTWIDCQFQLRVPYPDERSRHRESGLRVTLLRHRDVVAKDQQAIGRIKTAPSGTRQVDFRPGVGCSIYRGRVTIDIARPVDAEPRLVLSFQDCTRISWPSRGRRCSFMRQQDYSYCTVLASQVMYEYDTGY